MGISSQNTSFDGWYIESQEPWDFIYESTIDWDELGEEIDEEDIRYWLEYLSSDPNGYWDHLRR